jgi:hypothetical protein
VAGYMKMRYRDRLEDGKDERKMEDRGMRVKKRGASIGLRPGDKGSN